MLKDSVKNMNSDGLDLLQVNRLILHTLLLYYSQCLYFHRKC